MMIERKFPDRLFNKRLFVGNERHFTSTNSDVFPRNFDNPHTIAG